jgi:hypothetical protein
MLICVHWYAAYPRSLRHTKEMMAERGVFVDHATLHRWAIKILPILALVFRRRKHAMGSSMAKRNQAPKPFKWTFAGFELQTGEPLRLNDDAYVRRTTKGR